MNFPNIDNVTDLLKTFLDVQSRRAQVVASNIANADTPGYTAKELKFDKYLQDAAAQAALPQSRRSQQAPSASDLSIVEQTPVAAGLDGNTVDSGKEMADLAQIGTNFNLGAKMLQSRFRLLRMAIREGR